MSQLEEQSKELETVKVTGARKVLVLIAILLTQFAIGFSLFKLIPMITILKDFWHVEDGLFGIYNASGSIVAIIAVLPMAYLARKIKPKLIAVIGFIVLIGGGLLGAVAPDFIVFTIARVFEGAGMTLLAMVMFTLTVTLTAGTKNAGILTAASVAASMVAMVVHLMVSPSLMVAGMSWQTIYLLIAGIGAVMLVLWLILAPNNLIITGNLKYMKPTKEHTRLVYRTPSVWMVVIGVACFMIAVVVFMNYWPTYMMTRGMDIVQSNAIFGIASFVGIIAMLVYGILSDRLHTKRKLAIFAFLSTAIGYVLLIVIPVVAMPLFVIIFTMFPRAVLPMTKASGVDLVDNPNDVPIVLSLSDTMMNLSATVGALIIGVLLQFFGFDVTFIVMAVLLLIGGIAWIFAKRVP